ncbi:MAG: hypothetical protein SFY68_13380 [Candidatus Sumerlaeia bacterium]|nr:hypothetical protein [Candidatus Sumerlaeia bacterium]
MSESRTNLYTITGEPETRVHIQRVSAQVTEVGTPVYLHTIQLAGKELEALEFFASIQTFTNVRDPRVPMLIDAWQEGTGVQFVTLELNGFPIDSSEAQGILSSHGNQLLDEIGYQTLATLAVLHSQNATHRRVRKEVFAVHETGFIFMKDCGLLDRLQNLASQQFDDAPGGMLLASNLAAYDVVDWAAMMATMITRVPILDPSRRKSEEELLPEEVDQAQRQLIQLMGETPMAIFLNKCLQARADNVPVFDQAGDALKHYPGKEKT